MEEDTCTGKPKASTGQASEGHTLKKHKRDKSKAAGWEQLTHDDTSARGH